MYDTAFNEGSYVRTATTDENGNWEFTNLASTGYVYGDDGSATMVVYGYRVNVLEIPATYGVAPRDAAADAALDSDLDEDTTRLVPDAAVDGLIVLALPLAEDEVTKLAVEGPDGLTWSAMTAVDSTDNDAGLRSANAVISGIVWQDANRDGLQQNRYDVVPGQTVVLQRQLGTLEEAINAGMNSRTSDGATGSDLDAVGEPLTAASRWLESFGLLPSIPVEPEPGTEEDPTDPDDPDGPDNPDDSDDPENPDGEGDNPEGGDPDDPMTTDAGDGTGDGDGTGGDGDGDGDNTDDPNGTSPSDPDNGADDGTNPDDDAVAGGEGDPRPEFDLAKAVLSEGEWEDVATTVSDANGYYEFADLPVMDEYGRPYSYRVLMLLPNGAEWLPVNVGQDDNDDNDWGHMVSYEEEFAANQGATNPMRVLALRGAEGAHANAYGVVYDYFSPYSWTEDLGRSADLGFFDEDPLVPIAKTGDEVRWALLLLLAAVALSVAGMAARRELTRRRAEAAAPRGAHAKR